MFQRSIYFVACLSSALWFSCGTPPEQPVDGGQGQGTDDGGVPDAGNTPDAGGLTCGKVAVTCSDLAILKLYLLKTVATGNIVNTAEDAGFTSVVDATAGVTGGQTTPQESYVYAKFTETGLSRVGIHDEEALDSMGWDIAFRRYVVRLNGGDSGPSCTGATTMPNGMVYEDIASPPAGATYGMDNFFSKPPACTFVPDSTGLGSTPMTQLSSYFDYQGCLKMSGKVYVLQLASGRHVKLTVTGYYYPASAQAYCEANDTPQAGTSGTLTVRWAFLD